MAQGRNPHRLSHPFSIPARWHWIRWPVIVLSGGGAAVTLWEEEALLVECAPLAVLPLLAGPLYLFNHLVFKATKPRREDLPVKDNHQTTPKRLRP